MPCSDGRDFLSPEGVINYELKAELNSVTRILCGLLTDIEESGGMLLNGEEAIEKFEQEYRLIHPIL